MKKTLVLLGVLLLVLSVTAVVTAPTVSALNFWQWKYCGGVSDGDWDVDSGSAPLVGPEALLCSSALS